MLKEIKRALFYRCVGVKIYDILGSQIKLGYLLCFQLHNSSKNTCHNQKLTFYQALKFGEEHLKPEYKKNCQKYQLRCTMTYEFGYYNTGYFNISNIVIIDTITYKRKL